MRQRLANSQCSRASGLVNSEGSSFFFLDYNGTSDALAQKCSEELWLESGGSRLTKHRDGKLLLVFKTPVMTDTVIFNQAILPHFLIDSLPLLSY